MILASTFSTLLSRTYSNLMLPLKEALGMDLSYHSYLSRDLISAPFWQMNHQSRRIKAMSFLSKVRIRRQKVPVGEQILEVKVAS